MITMKTAKQIIAGGVATATSLSMGMAPVVATGAMFLAPASAIADTGKHDATEAGKQTIEIDGLAEGCEVTFYKVANYENGTGYHWIIDGTDLPTIEKRTEDLDSWSTDEANLIVSRAVSYTGTAMSTGSATASGTGVAKFATNERGIWAATVKNSSDAKVVYQNMILTVNGTTDSAYVDVKKTDMTVSKVAEDPSVGVGEKAIYDITSTTPAYATNATDRTYQIVDTLPEGMTFNEITEIKDSVGTTYTKDTDYTVSSEGQKVTVKFTNDGIKKFSAGATLTTKLAATREANHDGVLNNVVDLIFSDDSYTSHTTTTTEDETPVYDFCLDITKVESNSGTALAGAKFTIQDKDGNYLNADGSKAASKTELSVDDNGKLEIHGLDAASYVITETVAPDGHIITDSPVNITLNATYEGEKLTGYTVSGDKTATGTIVESITDTAHNEAAFNIENPKQGLLPQTGEAGTIAVTVIGAGMIALGAGVAIRRRNAKQE